MGGKIVLLQAKSLKKPRFESLKKCKDDTEHFPH